MEQWMANWEYGQSGPLLIVGGIRSAESQPYIPSKIVDFLQLPFWGQYNNVIESVGEKKLQHEGKWFKRDKNFKTTHTSTRALFSARRWKLWQVRMRDMIVSCASSEWFESKSPSSADVLGIANTNGKLLNSSSSSSSALFRRVSYAWLYRNRNKYVMI